VRRSGGKREEVRSSGGGRGCVEAGGGKEKHGRGGRKWGKKLDPIVEEEQKKNKLISSYYKCFKT
jgi:hypothetical protein